MEYKNNNKIKKILLLVPPCSLPMGKLKVTVPPLGLGYIAAVLEKEGYLVEILDATVEGFRQEVRIDHKRIRYGLSYGQIKEIIKEFNPDVAGISCHSTSQFENSLDTCKAVREVNKKIITILGGIHPSTFPYQILEENEVVDFIVIGEGEYTFRDLLTSLNKPNSNFLNIDGLAYRVDSGIKANLKTELIRNLDELPFPARHLLPIEKYFKVGVNQNLSNIKRNLQIISSRGCPFKCTFCATTIYWGNKYRNRSPENVIAEIDHLVKEYKIRELQFTDDSLTADYNSARKVFELLKERKYKLKWSVPNGINVCTLDEELLKLMKESGCYEIRLAIESGTQEILQKVIQKPVNLKHVKEIIAISKKLGLSTSGFFAIGFPGETLEDIKQTFRFAREAKIDAAFISIATPLPGTRLMEICREKGYLAKDFSFRGSEFTSASIRTEQFSQKELEKIYIRETLLLNVTLLFRNPRAFLQRYGYFLLCHPDMVISYIFNYISRIFKRGDNKSICDG